MSTPYQVTHVNWEVWWIKDDGTRKRVKYGKDFAAAQELHAKALAAGKRGATLRSANVAFPPPLKYADTEKVPIGRRKRTREIVYRTQLIDPPQYFVKMMSLNRRGIWWCCYCMKLRKFVKRKGSRVQGIWMDDPHYACPLCGASHRVVSRYNPIASVLEAKRSRRPRGRRRRG